MVNHSITTGISKPSRLSWAVLTGFAMLTSACTPTELYPPLPPRTPEQLEFTNMRSSNIIPKSSPAAFVKAFDSFCLNGGSSYDSMAAKLRKSDYIAAPEKEEVNLTAFVVDDARPMVIVSDDGQYCAAAAESRAGQTARIQRFIAARFPKAASIAPRKPNFEALFKTNGNPDGLIALVREPSATAGSRLQLAIQRSN